MTEPLWRQLNNLFHGLSPGTINFILNLIADEVERRGTIDYDRDPGETADWLRAEANQALKDAEV